MRWRRTWKFFKRQSTESTQKSPNCRNKTVAVGFRNALILWFLALSGKIKWVELNKYERNLLARKKYMEAHGTSCAVCGIDFGEKCGSNYKGDYWSSSYCTNQPDRERIWSWSDQWSGTALSKLSYSFAQQKKDGIYTIEELTELMNKTHRELYSDESVVASYEKYLNEVGKWSMGYKENVDYRSSYRDAIDDIVQKVKEQGWWKR